MCNGPAMIAIGRAAQLYRTKRIRRFTQRIESVAQGWRRQVSLLKRLMHGTGNRPRCADDLECGKTKPARFVLDQYLDGPKDFGDVYGFYGPRGSGFGRVEAWYYGCDRISCGLFAMIKYSALRSKEEEPKLSFESDSLVIRYGKGGILILK